MAKQVVHPDDSVLGPLSRDRGFLTTPGLTTTYRATIQAAFLEEYWESDKLFDLAQNEIGTGAPANTDQYTLMEMNLSLLWGLAIQLYESTLVSDDSLFDRFMAGDTTALTPEERVGMRLFLESCAKGCHRMPEITKATIDHMIEFPTGEIRLIERMTRGEGEVYDGGFYNFGVRPTAEDLGRGGTVSVGQGEDAIEQPLSFTRYALLYGEAANRIGTPLDPPLGASEPTAVDGAFRTPSLRNAELTGPYYHNGGLATLRDVVMFYVRGGDFGERNTAIADALKGRPDRRSAPVPTGPV